jgi:calcineurin-like phosphoesterase family protein
MAVFFTSDTHFGDHRTLNIHKRPFANVQAMDAELQARWNAAIGADDDVWHLGDFGRSGGRAAQVFETLNGRKRLLVGNNDDAATLNLPWEWVGSYRELELDGRFLVLCHYPFRSWNRQHRGAINLHGHSHGRMKALSRQMDVGVDAHDFRPVPLERITASRPLR